VRRNIKKSHEKQKKYYDKTAKCVSFEIDDPVYLHNSARKGKLDKKWLPYYRIMRQNTPVNYTIYNQLTGDTKDVHASHLKHAKLDYWPKQAKTTTRKARYVVTPDYDSTDTDSTDDTDFDTDDNLPLSKLRETLRNEEPDKVLTDRVVENAKQMTTDHNIEVTDESSNEMVVDTMIDAPKDITCVDRKYKKASSRNAKRLLQSIINLM